MTTPWDAAGVTADGRLAGLLARLDQQRRLAGQRQSLGIAEGRLLWLLIDRGPRTLREVADDLELEQSTVNRQVNAALAAGLVHRYREAGRPARLVAPTPRGRAVFERDVDRMLRLYRAGLAELGADDADRLVALLDRFVTAYGSAVHSDTEAGTGSEARPDRTSS